MTTAIKPCGHNLVVEPLKLPEKSKGGIIITHAGTMFEKLEKAGRMVGVIKAIGPQCWAAHAAPLLDLFIGDPKSRHKDPMLQPWAKEGDTVLYSRHAGKFIFDPVSTVEMYIIHDEDVLAVLPPREEWAESLLALTA